MTEARRLVLVIEDEDDMRNGLQHNLEYEGYRTMLASRGRSGLDKALSGLADLVILDVMLPEMSGFEILRTMRDRGVRTPVILLTSKGLEKDKIEGFSLGADDYVTKPFSIGELLARVRAVMSRATPQRSSLQVFEFADVRIDFQSRRAFRGDQELNLALKEFEILRLLISNRGLVVSRDLMLRDVWGYNPGSFPETRTVDNHIAKLRSKIGADHIETVPKQGYRFSG